MDEDDLRPAQIRSLTGVIRHRLCAGQVCVSVASCVKELIENSLDAHSTRLQLTFIAHGADLIELVDNGDGIAEHDFEKIGLFIELKERVREILMNFYFSLRITISYI